MNRIEITKYLNRTNHKDANSTLILNTVVLIDQLDYYLVPTCFILGLLGNLIGSMCLFNSKHMRKRTPLFVLASIGLADSLLLVSQMQRWLATYYHAQNTFLLSHSMCKFYFMFLRCSLLFSASLTFVLVITRFISIYLGTFRLSTYSNLGQTFSRLCVGYLFALALSLSWHELWTSGLKSANIAILELENDYHSPVTPTTSAPILSELTCSKNVASYAIVDSINFVYFLIVSLIYSFLFTIPIVVLAKMKNLNKHFSFCYYSESSSNLSDYNYSDSRERNRNKKSYSLPLFKSPNSNSEDIIQKQASATNLNKSQSINKLQQKLKPRPRRFSSFICLVSFLNALFCLPFVVFDLIFYKDVDPLLNNNESHVDLVRKSYQRLPLILLNIPHAIKFYLLFIFYSKFRQQLSKFLKIRFYVNKNLIKYKFKSNSPNNELTDAFVSKEDKVRENFALKSLEDLSSYRKSSTGSSANYLGRFVHFILKKLLKIKLR